mgnify:CR=1 FL=1
MGSSRLPARCAPSLRATLPSRRGARTIPAGRRIAHTASHDGFDALARCRAFGCSGLSCARARQAGDRRGPPADRHHSSATCSRSTRPTHRVARAVAVKDEPRPRSSATRHEACYCTDDRQDRGGSISRAGALLPGPKSTRTATATMAPGDADYRGLGRIVVAPAGRRRREHPGAARRAQRRHAREIAARAQRRLDRPSATGCEEGRATPGLAKLTRDDLDARFPQQPRRR